MIATVQALFNLAGRQTEGFVKSLFGLLGLDLPVLDHTTLARRLGKVAGGMPVAPGAGAMPVVVNATGVEGSGEDSAVGSL